ncbi:MAG: NACHT domain-containing protein [Crocosphaera sp.]|nr:NACHT domain-containing protein [Crocosphaera sp.]
MLDPITVGQQIMSDPTIQEAAVKGLATVFSKVVGETGIKLLGEGGSLLLEGSSNLTEAAKNLLFPVFKQYVIKYNQRHGFLNVLGMGKPVSLESVYTKVNFRPETLRGFESLEAQETVFRKRALQDEETRLGMTVAKETDYLMVLGGPGTGKSTFLRKLGLEALKGEKGEYIKGYIPVLLELRELKYKEVDLVEKIGIEFKNCGLEKYQECTQELLNQGKLLILLDGLDEVPTEWMAEISTKIKNLVDTYSKNRFVASCRIAAFRNFHSFQRFNQVVIADFDDEQVEAFINNWFASHSQPEWGQQCWEKLSSENYKATKELTRTPLLLTLICLLFRKTGQFPANKYTVYERTLKVLLEEWDASKEITRQRIYKELDTRRKELMLAQIAYDNFVDNVLFFPGREIAKQIERVLGKMLPKDTIIDGRVVLREVELQHGILVERQGDIYSFSHLTLQEYLTMVHIFDEDLLDQKLVDKYLCDSRWREVFLSWVGFKKADSLLLMMEKKTQSLMNTPKLQGLLRWVEGVTSKVSGEIKPVGKRAIAIANAYANAYAYAYAYANAYANALAYALAYANALANALAYALANALALANVNANANALAYANALTLANANALTLANANANANANAKKAIDEMIKYVNWSKEAEIYHGINLIDMIDKLEVLEAEISDDSHPKETSQAFSQKLIKVILEGFNLTEEMLNLSESEIKALEDYLYANKFMVDCKEEAVKFPDVWHEIEARMLLPNN